METFDRCIRAVLSEEGGLSDHPQDPGGLTKYGISRRAYPDLDIRRLTMDDAIDLYRRDYWNPVRGTDLPASLALLVFDAAVNQGAGTAARLLQKAVGVTEDGKIGPVTLRAALALPLEQVLIDFCAERALRYEFNRNEETFGRGWYRRLFRMYATALGNRLLQVALALAWRDTPMQPNDSPFRLYPTRTISGYHGASNPTGILRMAKRTPLYARHAALGAKLVDFGGWDMPLHYGSQLDEHHRVRRVAGVFDVSHMTVVDFADPDPTRALLRHLLANDVARLYPGKALYTCMLNEAGGVIDDLIVYDRGETGYRLVLNAATRDKDLSWIAPHAERFGAAWRERDDLAMLAVQGPEALTRLESVLGADTLAAVRALKPFHALETDHGFIARTGYTGEDGVEILPNAATVPELWDRIVAAGVAPCGLGARDTLRLEAGMNLYGSDMDETTTPLVSGLGWTVAWEPTERDFIGRAALERQRATGAPQTFVGLVLEERGVLRGHQHVFDDEREIGQITSGTFSPTLNRAIALARVDTGVGARCQVEIRGKRLPARVVKPPFVRHGRALIE